MVEFYCLNFYTSQFIWVVNFKQVKFRSVSLTLRYSNLEERVDIRELSFYLCNLASLFNSNLYRVCNRLPSFIVLPNTAIGSADYKGTYL